MSNITYQIIPFAFLFVILLFFLSLKKGNNLKNKNFTNTVEINKYDFFKFLESTEKKLLLCISSVLIKYKALWFADVKSINPMDPE